MNECSVCLLGVDPEDSVNLGCGHEFHDICIRKWCASQKHCPTCRKPAFEWILQSMQTLKLSQRLEIFVDYMGDSWTPGDFWPSWLVLHLKESVYFSEKEKAYVKDLAFQSFDRLGFFKVLKLLESSREGIMLGTSPPTRSNAFMKMYM